MAETTEHRNRKTSYLWSANYATENCLDGLHTYVDQVLQDIETIFSDDITLNSFNLSKLVPAAVTDFPR